MTSSSFWLKVGQTKLCLEWASTTISAHAVRRRPVSGSWTRPRRPKSSSATPLGAASAIRTVPLWRRCQLRRRIHRCGDEYEIRQPLAASTSWMRVMLLVYDSLDATACAGRPLEPWGGTATTLWHLISRRRLA